MDRAPGIGSVPRVGRLSFVVLLGLSACEGAIGGADGAPLVQEGQTCGVEVVCEPGLECRSGTCRRRCSTSLECTAGRRCGLELDGARLCVDTGTAARFAECERAEDCATGLCAQGVCTDFCMACEQGAACLESDVDSLVGAGRQVVCRPRRAAPQLVLGPVETSSTGRSSPLAIELPPGQASMTIVLSSEEGLRPAISRLEGPDGTLYVDRGEANVELNPMVVYIETSSMLLPNASGIRAESGTWTLELGTYDPEVFDRLVPLAGVVDTIEVIFEPEPEVGGLLDLHVGLAPSFGVTATTAGDSGFVRGLLEEVRATLLTPAGVDFGRVLFSVLPEEHERVEDGDETRRMCRNLSIDGTWGANLNLFVVGDIIYTSGQAGGIPGPPGVFASTASCVLIERIGGGTRTGVLAAHEMGHFLGLRHTTELDGRTDPLDDTPSCENGTRLQDCPDYRNLMFPRFPAEPGLRLSAEQIEVIRRNPLLHEP